MSLLGTQPVSAAVGVMHYGMTQLPAQFAPIASSQASAKTIAPAPAAGWTIVVLAYSITCGATANTWNFQSHTTTSVATGIHALPINGSIVAPYCPAGLFACAPGEALDILLTGATAVGGELTYVIVPPSVD